MTAAQITRRQKSVHAGVTRLVTRSEVFVRFCPAPRHFDTRGHPVLRWAEVQSTLNAFAGSMLILIRDHGLDARATRSMTVPLMFVGLVELQLRLDRLVEFQRT